jgi:hypothetical protein
LDRGFPAHRSEGVPVACWKAAHANLVAWGFIHVVGLCGVRRVRCAAAPAGPCGWRSCSARPRAQRCCAGSWAAVRTRCDRSVYVSGTHSHTHGYLHRYPRVRRGECPSAAMPAACVRHGWCDMCMCALARRRWHAWRPLARRAARWRLSCGRCGREESPHTSCVRRPIDFMPIHFMHTRPFVKEPYPNGSGRRVPRSRFNAVFSGPAGAPGILRHRASASQQ